MRSFNILDLSGGLQNITSHLVKKRQEVFDSKNAAYNIRIGSAVRRAGYEQVGQTVSYGQNSLYGGVYLYGGNNKLLAGVNSGNNATIQYLDSDNYWKNILTTAIINTKFQCLNYLDEFYIAGRAGYGQYQTLTNVDSTLIPSTTRNVLNAPACQFIAQYSGKLYAINVQVNGVNYPDRAYVSSAPMGAITFVQTFQSGLAQSLRVDSVKYLKVGMTIDIYGAGTNQLKVSGLTIVSVDKPNSRIGFTAQTLPNLNDNDEVWLNGRKGKLSILWNTDYPTPESSDWIRIPTGEDESAAFTGWGINNNRLLLFSRNSLLKWDGQNLIVLSPTIGCVSHNSIANIGPWTFWLHSSGIWGYNDNSGQVKLISKAITPLLNRITPSGFLNASAVTNGLVYKLAVGQLQDPILATTSTSTSSTSTSSTSSSTSSTSTSSTSTSSTTASTTTSTSSTSSSTSSTSSSTSSTSTSSTSSSTSTSSTSSSTSTSSTSTTTQPTNKAAVRICYDYNLNIWWYEEHNREMRFQFIHEMNGLKKPYFTDENGYMFRDETGLTDFGLSIPMVVETGRVNCGTEQGKIYDAVQIDSEKSRGAIIQYQLDGHDPWITLGQIKDDIQTLPFPQAGQAIQSRDINFRFVHNDGGEAPVVNGLTLYFNIVETLVNEIGGF